MKLGVLDLNTFDKSRANTSVVSSDHGTHVTSNLSLELNSNLQLTLARKLLACDPIV